MNPIRKDEQAAVLLVSLGVLALLGALGLTFVRLSTQERRGSENYVSSVRASMLAESGIAAAMALLQQRAINQHWETLQAADQQISGSIEPGTYSTSGDTYEVVVKDSASMLNINYGDQRLARMLDTLGKAISETDPPIKLGEGAKIVAWRNLQSGKKFHMLEDLTAIPGEIISESDFERIREYLTVKSWVDKSTIKPISRENQPTDGEVMYERIIPRNLELEPRPPVNINTASKPVLTAMLTGLSAGWTDHSPLDDLSGWQRYMKDRQNRLQRKPLGKRRHVKPISFEHASAIATEIIKNRNTVPGPDSQPYAGPFRSWKQFELFIDSFINGADQMITKAGFLSLTVVRGNISLRISSNEGTKNLYFGTRRETEGSSPYEVWGTGDQGETLYIHVPRMRPLGTFRIFFGSPISILIDRPEGTYELNCRGLALRSTAWLISWAFPNEIKFTPSTSRDSTLTNEQGAMLKAAFNPNTMLNKFNPDAIRYRLIDKTDLLDYTTEFCFNSGGMYEILSRGTVKGPRGEIVSSAVLSAHIKLYDIYVQTTQQDFEKGEILDAGTRLVAVKGGKTLISYPQPDIKGLPAKCQTDGYLMLSHYQPKLPDMSFAARFDKGFDGETAAGSARLVPDKKGPLAADLFSSAAGRLYPDGVYSDRDNCPAWRALGNMGGLKGTISFWVKTDWSADDEKNTHHLFSASHSVATWVNTQTFQLAYFGYDWNIFGIQTEAAHVRNDWLNERVSAARYSPRAHHWTHVVFQYSLGAETFDEAIYLQLNGTEARDWRGYSWPGKPTETEDLSLNGNLFRLGERPGLIDYVINPTRAADSTFDELVLSSSEVSRDRLRSMYNIGRYYNGGDASYTSPVLPFDGKIPPTATLSGDKLPVKGRLASIAWTRYVPVSVPGGGITFRVRNGDSWIDVKAEEGGGSLGGKRISGLVQYSAKFVETATEFVRPLVESMVLDDVRITVLRDPEITHWEWVFKSDRRFEAAKAIVQGSIDIGPSPTTSPRPVIFTPPNVMPPAQMGLGGKAAGGALEHGGGVLQQMAGGAGGAPDVDQLLRKAWTAPGGGAAPANLAERAQQGGGQNWRNSILPLGGGGNTPGAGAGSGSAPESAASAGTTQFSSGGTATFTGGSKGASGGGASGSGSDKGGKGDNESRFTRKKPERHKAVQLVIQIRNAEDQKPVRGAAIEVYRDQALVFGGMRTDRKGKCRLLLLTGKNYEVRIRHRAYQAVKKPLRLKPDDTTIEIELNKRKTGPKK